MTEEKQQVQQENVEMQETSEEAVQEEAIEEEATVNREQELLEQIQQLEKEKEELNNKYLRAQADIQNVRNRAVKEREQLITYQSQRVIESLLPVVDNFERALEAGKSENSSLESLLQGIEMVFRQIEQLFDQEGVQAIPAVGQPFDPNLHQAVMQEESVEHESGIVIQEFQKGYQLKGRVIRPSMVKVSS